jgi:hypothetical protein
MVDHVYRWQTYTPTALGSQVFLTYTFLFLYPIFFFYVHKYHD